MQRNSWICRRFSPTYNVLYDRFSNSLYPSSINGIKVGTHITHPYPSLSWKIIDNVPAGLFLPQSFGFCRFPFHRLPPRKNVLVPYLVISFLDNAPRDASNPFLPCFSPLSFPPSMYFHRACTRNILTDRIVLLGWFLLARMGANRCRENILKREIFLLPRRVTNAPTISIITGG